MFYYTKKAGVWVTDKTEKMKKYSTAVFKIRVKH